MALRYGFVDRPGGRRVNTRTIPRAGGVAFASAFLLVALGILALDTAVDSIALRGLVRTEQLVALLGGGLAAMVLGLLDDVFQLRARWQLLGQLALATSAVWLGIRVLAVDDPFGIGPDPAARPDRHRLLDLLVRRHDQQHQLHRRARRAVVGIGLIAAVTLGLISLTGAGGPFGQPLVAVDVLHARRRVVRVPALELPPGVGVHGHVRDDVRGLHAGRPVGPGHGQGRDRAAGAGRAHHRRVLDHRPAAREPPARRSAPIAGTSTTACSTWG